MFDSFSSINSYQYKGIIKVVFAGDSNTGKTNIFNRLTDNPFQINSQATIGVDFRFKNIDYMDNVYKV